MRQAGRLSPAADRNSWTSHTPKCQAVSIHNMPEAALLFRRCWRLPVASRYHFIRYRPSVIIYGYSRLIPQSRRHESYTRPLYEPSDPYVVAGTHNIRAI